MSKRKAAEGSMTEGERTTLRWFSARRTAGNGPCGTYTGGEPADARALAARGLLREEPDGGSWSITAAGEAAIAGG